MIDLSRWLHPEAEEIYRDDYVLAVSKPSGVVSHPNPPQNASPHAILSAPYDFKKESYVLSGSQSVYLVHRLDKETSGLLLFCFDSKPAEKLQKAIADHKIEKEYLALLVGVPSPNEGKWEHRLEKSPRESKVRVLPGAPNAISIYRVMEAFKPPGLSLTALFPKTGKTHQLRVQAAKRGFPIAGDRQYGNFSSNRELTKKLGLNRMFLHAAGIVFLHPATGKTVELSAPLPQDLLYPLGKLKKLFKKR